MSMYPNELELHEIQSYIEKLLLEVYQEEFGNVTLNKSDYYSGVDPTFQVTLIYNKKYNKVYMMYLIDNKARQKATNYVDFYKRISGRIINTCWADLNTKIRVEIINNTHYPVQDKGMKNSPLAPKDAIRLNTISIFKDFDEEWRFLEDESIAINNMYTKIYHDLDDNSIDKGIEDKLSEFVEKLKELNEKYDFNDNSNVPKAFNEFKDLYKLYFDVELTPIDDDNIITCNYIIDYFNAN